MNQIRLHGRIVKSKEGLNEGVLNSHQIFKIQGIMMIVVISQLCQLAAYRMLSAQVLHRNRWIYIPSIKL